MAQSAGFKTWREYFTSIYYLVNHNAQYCNCSELLECICKGAKSRVMNPSFTRLNVKCMSELTIRHAYSIFSAKCNNYLGGFLAWINSLKNSLIVSLIIFSYCQCLFLTIRLLSLFITVSTNRAITGQIVDMCSLAWQSLQELSHNFAVAQWATSLHEDPVDWIRLDQWKSCRSRQDGKCAGGLRSSLYGNPSGKYASIATTLLLTIW